jgi:hypothetical protein
MQSRRGGVHRANMNDMNDITRSIVLYALCSMALRSTLYIANSPFITIAAEIPLHPSSSRHSAVVCYFCCLRSLYLDLEVSDHRLQAS